MRKKVCVYEKDTQKESVFYKSKYSYFWGSQNSLWARGLLGCACNALCLDLRDGDMSIFKL